MTQQTGRFREDMTSVEAWKVLFSSVYKGQPQEERDEIMAEYRKVLPAIIKREHEESEGYLTSYQI